MSSPSCISSNINPTSPPTPLQAPEASELSDISGVFWECIGREETREGRIYRFKAVQAFDEQQPARPDENASERAAEKINEMYPAIEFISLRAKNFFAQNNAHFTLNGYIYKGLVVSICDYTHKKFAGVPKETNYKVLDSHPQSKKLQMRLFGNDIDFESVERDIDQDLIKSIECIQYLEELGYRLYTSESGEAILELPDLATLLSRWKGLQVKYPHLKLPDLKIISRDGISDIAFVEGYFANDALLSTEKGFCQDHFGHVMTRLMLMLKNGDAYPKLKEQCSLSLQLIHQAVQTALLIGGRDIKDHKDLLYCLLGMLTDTQYDHEIACVQKAMSLPYHDLIIKSIWTDPKWLPYLNKRFPGRSFEAMPAVWKHVCELFSRFNREQLATRTIVSEEDAENYLKDFTLAYAWDRVMRDSFFKVPALMEGLKKASDLLKAKVDPAARALPKFEVVPRVESDL